MAKNVKSIEREWVGVNEAELMTGRSSWSWRKDAYSGRVASCKIGSRLLLPVAEVRRIMYEGMRPADDRQGAPATPECQDQREPQPERRCRTRPAAILALSQEHL